MEEYEADLEVRNREYGEAWGEVKRLQAEAVLTLSTLVGATGEIPSVEACLIGGGRSR